MSHLAVPQGVVFCPYCSASLALEPQEWDDDGRIIYATVYCEADMDAFNIWLQEDKETDYDEGGHGYGYDSCWLDAVDRALNWARTQRVVLPAPDHAAGGQYDKQ